MRRCYTFILLLFGILCLSTLGAQAEQQSLAWEELPRPNVGQGLMMEPRLLGFGSRLHLIWIGTTEQVSKPELFHATISGSSREWTGMRAPFFGQNKSRVRRLAIGRSKNLVTILLERTLTQGNDAYEVLSSISGDQGWSWGKLVEIDQFVSDVSGGTAVAITGRDAPNRVEFAMAWSRDFGSVRLASTDLKSQLRPTGVNVGVHNPKAMKVEIGVLGRDGFCAVFQGDSGLVSAQARALNGKIDEGTTFLRGQYGRFFSLASSPYGPSRLIAGSGGSLSSFTSDGTNWKDDQQVAVLPFSTADVASECDLDGDKNLHVAMVVPQGKGYELWYIGQTHARWGKPELVASFTEEAAMHGFDIATTDNYIFIAASQGFHAKYFRRKLAP